MSSPNPQHSDWIEIPPSCPTVDEFLDAEGLPDGVADDLARVLDEFVEALCGPDYENLVNWSSHFQDNDVAILRGAVGGWYPDLDLEGKEKKKKRSLMINACRDYLIGRGFDFDLAVRWAPLVWDYLLLVRRHVMAAG